MVWTDYDDVNAENAYNHGFQAYLHGLNIGDNPYAPGSKSNSRWEAGWLDCQENSLTEWRD